MKWTPQLRTFVEDKLNERRWSFEDAARETGINATTWGRLLRNRPKQISSKTVEAICRIAGITEEQLIRIANGQQDKVCENRAHYGDPALDELCRIVEENRDVIPFLTWLLTHPEHWDTHFALAKGYGWEGTGRSTS